jgi:hypothetical protein
MEARAFVARAGWRGIDGQGSVAGFLFEFPMATTKYMNWRRE